MDWQLGWVGGLRLVSVVKWLRGGEVDQREKDVEDFSEPALLWQARACVGDQQSAPDAGNPISQHVYLQ